MRLIFADESILRSKLLDGLIEDGGPPTNSCNRISHESAFDEIHLNGALFHRVIERAELTRKRSIHAKQKSFIVKTSANNRTNRPVLERIAQQAKRASINTGVLQPYLWGRARVQTFISLQDSILEPSIH